MAALARMDQESRTVEVNRKMLVETLRTNREKHVAEYKAAMAGYKAALIEKIEEAFNKAYKTLDERFEQIKKKVGNFTDADISKQNDHFRLVDQISVEMKVPRCYGKEYDAAIDMATWDVRETLELTHAEFTCFVRDQWDWTSEFSAVNATYTSSRM